MIVSVSARAAWLCASLLLTLPTGLAFQADPAAHVVLPALSSVFSSKAMITNPSEGVSTLQETYVDGPRGRLLQNWSSPFGFSAQLVAGDIQAFFLLYLVNDTLVCTGGHAALPKTFPPPDYSALGQPTGFMVTAAGRPAYRFDATAAKYIGSFLFDVASGLPAGSMNSETDFTSSATFEYVNGTVTNPQALEIPTACHRPTTAPPQFNGKRGPSPAALTLSEEFIESLTDPRRMLVHHFGVAAAQAFGNPLTPPRSELVATVERYERGTQLGEASLTEDLPASVDNSQFATPIRNQGAACGACWAFSSVAASEVVYRKALQLNRTYDVRQWLSVQTVIDCAHDGPNSTALVPSQGCQGGWPSNALDFIAQNGLPQEADYAFQGVTGSRCHLPDVVGRGRSLVRPISRHYATPYLNATAMMEAVYRHGAVVSIILFFLTPPIGDALYAGGVYSNAACTPGLSHAVTIVGYGTTSEGVDYWLVKNSLGPGWGEGGYFKMARGINMCGIEDFGYVPVY